MNLQRWVRPLGILGLVLTMMVVGLYSSQKARAATFPTCSTSDFLCPDTSVAGSSQWDVIDLNVTPGPGGDSTSPQTVAAGVTITATMTYRVHQAYTSVPVDAWMNIDTTDYGPNGDPATQTTDPSFWVDKGGGSTSSPCPSWYYANRTDVAGRGPHYYSGNSGDVFAAGNYGTAYPTDGSNPFPYPAGGHMTCLQYGHFDVWAANRTAGDHSYTMKFQTNPNRTSGTYCVGAFIAMKSSAASTNRSDLYARARGGQKCFTLQPTTISGHVRSSIDTATGKPIGGVPVQYRREGQPDWTTISTDANGNFSFDSTEYQGYSINVKLDSTPNWQGTNYDGSSAYPLFYYDSCSSSSCSGYNFELDPLPTPPPVSKSSNPGSGTAVRPGDRIDYAVTVNNVFDSDSSSAVVTDNIPLNINPGSVVIDSVSLVDWPGTPAGWRPSTGNGVWTTGNYNFNGPTQCNDTPQLFAFGYGGVFDRDGGLEDLSDLTCAVHPGSGSQAPFIKVEFDTMPAYSTIVVRWHGNVKAAQDIGVYPGDPNAALTGHPFDPNSPASGDYRYCLGSGISFESGGRHTECEDKSTGLQGVSNFATTIMDSSSPSYSNITYNPIPGNVKCLIKTADAHFNKADLGGVPEPYFNLPDTASIASNGAGCGVPYPTNGAYQFVSTGTAGFTDYSLFNYKMSVYPDKTLGPVEYAVNDYSSGLGTDAASSLNVINMVFQAYQNMFSNAAAVGNAARWQGLISTDVPYSVGGHQDYIFGSKYAGGNGVGTTLTDKSSVCWLQYWYSGHPLQCLEASQNLKVSNITGPIPEADNGAVHAGGTPGDITAPQGTCGIANGSGGYIYTLGGTGRYIVEAAGAISGFSSVAGSLGSSVGSFCRPDIAASANAYATHATFGGCTLTGSPAYSGQVVDVDAGACGGTVTIRDLTVRGRWTLHVKNGDVNIVSTSPQGTAIFYSTALNGVNSSPSFGLVVDGSIYIDKTVKDLMGYYYATSRINTCAAKTGATVVSLGNNTGDFSVADCRSVLTVHGLLMSQKLRLNRTAVTNSGGAASASEILDSIPQLFLFTPPGFNTLNVDTTNNSIQELRPRY